MKTVFNLSKFRKQAYNDDGRGLVQKQTRAFMNCYKTKMSSGKGAHDAWMSCLEEYQNSNNSDWGMKYASSKK